jgi:hypothetical protein
MKVHYTLVPLRDSDNTDPPEQTVTKNQDDDEVILQLSRPERRLVFKLSELQEILWSR